MSHIIDPEDELFLRNASAPQEQPAEEDETPSHLLGEDPLVALFAHGHKK